MSWPGYPVLRDVRELIMVRLLIGLLVFAGVVVWQVKTIAGSRNLGLRAAGALGMSIPLYLVLLASTYFLMERASAASAYGCSWGTCSAAERDSLQASASLSAPGRRPSHCA